MRKEEESSGGGGVGRARVLKGVPERVGVRRLRLGECPFDPSAAGDGVAGPWAPCRSGSLGRRPPSVLSLNRSRGHPGSGKSAVSRLFTAAS
jgi:hypothetical protein